MIKRKRRYVSYRKPRELTIEQLSEGSFWFRHFFTALRDSNATEKTKKWSSDVTWPNRYRWHYDFLNDYEKEINSFADIGAGLKKGAPTTRDAKQHLGESSRVLATDIQGNVRNPELERAGVEAMKHSIVDSKLPDSWDVIRFSNVARYMTKKEVRRALRNIHRSLGEGGLLMNERFIYRKTPEGFEAIARARYTPFLGPLERAAERASASAIESGIALSEINAR